MRRLLTIITESVLFSVFSFNTYAQVKAKPFFTAAEMPSGWYVAPPKEGSEDYIRDIKTFYWGRSERLNPERAAIAERDAEYGYENMIFQFSKPLGMSLSERDTPQICRLLRDALATSDSILKLPQSTIMRATPFKVFHETPMSGKNMSLKSSSYPSVHSTHSWLSALLLMEINPEAADSLLTRAYLFGENSVVLGLAWQSDVDAGRLAASVAYAKLQSSGRFKDQMSAAKKEYQELKGQFPPVVNPLHNDSSYIRHTEEIANMKSMERSLQCRIIMYSFGFDDVTGLKMLYINNNSEFATVPKAVTHVLLANEHNEVVYVVLSIIRHVVDNEQERYGCYVLGKDNMAGEIEISVFEYEQLQRMLFYSLSEYENFTGITSRVIDSSRMIPFSPVDDKYRVTHHRFFEVKEPKQERKHPAEK